MKLDDYQAILMPKHIKAAREMLVETMGDFLSWQTDVAFNAAVKRHEQRCDTLEHFHQVGLNGPEGLTFLYFLQARIREAWIRDGMPLHGERF